MSKTKRVWEGPEYRKKWKEDRLKKRKEEQRKKRSLTESPTPSKNEDVPKKKKRTHSDVSIDDGEPWMTGALGMSAPLGSSVALAEQDSDNVIDTTEKKRKKKKKSKHSHAVELETEEKGEAEPPVTPAKVAHFYTPILPPPSPFAKKREVEAEIFKAETILPLKITPSAGKEAGKVVPAATSSIVNDNKGLCNFYTQDWENTVGYVRANVKSNMDAESQVEENIAFSEKYLSDPVRSETGINIAGVNFRTLNVKAGILNSLTAPLDQPALQIFSVAKGQVTVFLDEQRFDISKGGMWNVKPSEKCTVKRRKHKSTVYITTVPAV